MKHLALTPVRLAVLAATLGGAAATMVWVAAYRVSAATPTRGTEHPSAWGVSITQSSPAWTTPVLAVIAIAVAGVATLVLLRR